MLLDSLQLPLYTRVCSLSSSPYIHHESSVHTISALLRFSNPDLASSRTVYRRISSTYDLSPAALIESKLSIELIGDGIPVGALYGTAVLNPVVYNFLESYELVWWESGVVGAVHIQCGLRFGLFGLIALSGAFICGSWTCFTIFV